MMTIKGTGSKQATVSGNGNGFHVVFWINAEQVSHSKSGRMYITQAGALRAARAWAAQQ